ncbi:MAG: hypothetical protein BGO67_01685 [Alphaproteobacteria bacterium 41-28]|nr:MAG: hypothetical protein BGO67_01685 [Alphaproteobacteria bacterium 41-28]
MIELSLDPRPRKGKPLLSQEQPFLAKDDTGCGSHEVSSLPPLIPIGKIVPNYISGGLFSSGKLLAFLGRGSKQPKNLNT